MVNDNTPEKENNINEFYYSIKNDPVSWKTFLVKINKKTGESQQVSKWVTTPRKRRKCPNCWWYHQ